MQPKKSTSTEENWLALNEPAVRDKAWAIAAETDEGTRMHAESGSRSQSPARMLLYQVLHFFPYFDKTK